MTHEERDEKFSLLVQRICDVLNLANELGYKDIFSEPDKLLKEQMKVAATLHFKDCNENLERCWAAMLDPRQSEKVQ